MSTVEKINLDGAAVINKLKRGEPLTSQDRELLKIYNALNGGKAINAGKRKGDKLTQKVK